MQSPSSRCCFFSSRRRHTRYWRDWSSDVCPSDLVTYVACAPKSNAATVAIGAAREDVKKGRTLQVPKHLRDTHYRGSEQLGHGEDYKYSHDYEIGRAACKVRGESVRVRVT